MLSSLRNKKFLVTLLLTITSVLVTVLVLELVLRDTHLFGARVSWSTPDSLVTFRFVPGSRYWLDKESNHPISGTINRHGWRDRDWSLRKKPGVYRVAVLGDSYVEAFQVESDSTFLRLTEARLREDLQLETEFMNFGRSGCTQSEELLILENHVLPLAPDKVILCFLPANDIVDIHRETAPNTLRPFYLENHKGQLILETRYRDTREFKLKVLIDPLKRKSALVSLLLERLSLLRAGRTMNTRVTSHPTLTNEENPRLRGSLSLCTQNPDPQLQRNYALNKKLIAHMARACRERGIGFMLVCLDTEAYSSEREQELLAIDSTFDAFFFDDDLRAFARSLGIEFLGLQSAFRQAHEQEKRLHWAHWNYNGHRVVARALSETLRPLLSAHQERRQEPASK